MSQQNWASQQAAPTSQKQRLNVYTMMLILAFAFLVLACVALWMYLSQYGDIPQWNTKSAQPSVSQVESMPAEYSLNGDIFGLQSDNCVT